MYAHSWYIQTNAVPWADRTVKHMLFVSVCVQVTLCDFEIRQLNNIQRWTFQCALPINLFNEQIFSFLWFWFIFVAIITIFSFGLWVARAIMRSNRSHYVRKFLKVGKHLMNF